ncbi:MAG: MogA/MoaB family molybdenum cofactor biosynthesis protein [Desulfovibrionaceae bacterium]|nr:MogA/MoaB family molybdenum cofactor biosynthesis protein [Desulfovibrionaceae bacterium]
MPTDHPSIRIIRPAPCRAGDILPLVSSLCDPPPYPAHIIHGPLPVLPVGTVLGGDAVRFQVAGRAFLPGVTHACPLARAWADCPPAGDSPAEALCLPVSREGWAVAVITLSDKGFAGQRQDFSGPAVRDALRAALPLCHEQAFVLPDEPAALRALALELAVGQGYDLIVSTGGTGLSPRDLTPEALTPVLDRRVPGLEQAMMRASLSKTPRAALSRALAGTVGSCLVLALPGSARAAAENLAAVLPALPHALAKLAGDPADCGG